jgi:hypothetical protein
MKVDMKSKVICFAQIAKNKFKEEIDMAVFVKEN